MLEGVIKRLSELKLAAALEGTQRPIRDGDMAFEYGRVVGRVQGLNEALEALDEALGREEARA